ncbi:MAG: hypothetical protein ACR2NU_11785 [Aeoliella sp.]
MLRLILLAMLVMGAAGESIAKSPTYQRTRHAWHGNHAQGQSKHFSHFHHHPQVSGAHFQRPYPYHLDYYRMRYGGDYAPYFGNLYGPPAVYAPYFGGQPSPYGIAQ